MRWLLLVRLFGLAGRREVRTVNAGFPIAALLAWLLGAGFYFFQYALRSAPSVMMPQLTEAFGVSALGVASIVGMFYYGYSPSSLVAGAAIDRFGAKRVIPIGAALVGVGALLLSTGNVLVASGGRLLQGVGGAFALVGAIYLATRNFPASFAGSMIGATQMFGMAGGSAGQFVVGPLIQGGLPWSHFWIYAGFLGVLLGAMLFLLLPAEDRKASPDGNAVASALRSLKIVFANPYSIICGIVAGLLFIPTTIFDMTWGVRYLEQGRSREYEDAVRVAASVPIGWMIGCPLLGYVSDRLGRRKPVIVAGALVLLAVFSWALFGTQGFFRGAAVGIVMGIASGVAMLPTTIIKEMHPPELGGSATGVVTFINFTFSALLGPVFGRFLVKVSEGTESLGLEHYQTVFAPMLVGIAVAAVLTLFLPETGRAARADAG